MKKILPFLIVLIFTGKMFAVDFNSDFSAANQFYAAGKFADAANAYEKNLSSGANSANLFFNYGNAEFKSGNLGKSIAAFRRAELLAPRDSEIRANLNFVRNQVQGASVRENFWEKWLGNFSLNEWTFFTAILFWLTFILFAARQIRPALAQKIHGVTLAAILLTIVGIAVLSVQAANHFSNQTAVILSASNARSGPFDDAQNAFPVHDGAELSVLDRHGNWVQIADGAGKSGWLKMNRVEILPGA